MIAFLVVVGVIVIYVGALWGIGCLLSRASDPEDDMAEHFRLGDGEEYF